MVRGSQICACFSRGSRVLIGILFLSACADSVGPLEPLVPPNLAEGDRQFIAMLNDYRQSVGCPALQWHASTAEVAERHSADMAARGYFGHVTPDGLTLADRLRKAGIRYRLAGENIAAGQDTHQEVFLDWLNSNDHREIIETCTFKAHGLGRAGSHWTLILLTE